jgi:hypothetical protein
MEKIDINTHFGEKPVHIEIGATMGAAGGFYVTIDIAVIIELITEKIL